MLRKRIIPIVLLDEFSVIKTIEFKTRRNLGSPITVARTYNTRNVDELILLDIDASRQNRAIDFFTIQDVAAELFMPLTVGGGIRTLDDIQRALQLGADKVSINTKALECPEFITEAANRFGSQCIVVSVDIKYVDNEWYIYHNGEIRKDLSLFKWLKTIPLLGAGELLINNVSLDGLMAGVDIAIVEEIVKSANIPVIYAGGIGSVEDCAKLGQSKVSALGISSLFHFTSITPLECKNAMALAGIAIRQ
jgi:cyclase